MHFKDKFALNGLYYLTGEYALRFFYATGESIRIDHDFDRNPVKVNLLIH